MADANDNLRRNAKRSIDWEAVEREYRTGQLSIREIGKLFDVSHAGIGKRARQEGWTRDLMGQVRRRANEILALRESPSLPPEQIEKAVEDGATRVVDIVLAHRKQASTARDVVQKLLDELHDPSTDLTAPVRTSMIQSLSTAMKTLVAIERQAFNVDAVEPEKPLTSENLTPERRKAALALLLAREDPAPSIGGVR